MAKDNWFSAVPLIGTAADIIFGGQSQRETNQANQGMAQDQMVFQERMSNTAHQREVDDLKKAGLNPILSANAGASSPSGASATLQAPISNDFGSKLADSVVQSALAKGNLDKIRSDTDVNESTISLQAKQGEAQMATARAAGAQAIKNLTDAKINEAALPAAKLHGEIDAKMAPLDAAINRIGTALHGAQSAKSLGTSKGATAPSDDFGSNSPNSTRRPKYGK